MVPGTDYSDIGFIVVTAYSITGYH